jgi:hypothetical protein
MATQKHSRLLLTARLWLSGGVLLLVVLAALLCRTAHRIVHGV